MVGGGLDGDGADGEAVEAEGWVVHAVDAAVEVGAFAASDLGGLGRGRFETIKDVEDRELSEREQLGFERQQAGRWIEWFGAVPCSLGLADRCRLGGSGSLTRPARTPAGSSRGRPPTPSGRPTGQRLPGNRSSPPDAPARPPVRRWTTDDSPPRTPNHHAPRTPPPRVLAHYPPLTHP